MEKVEINSFPRQKVSYYKKQEREWQEDCVDAVISECQTLGKSRRSDMKTKKRNYNLFNNQIDKSDFEYVLNPFNMSKEALNRFQFPASMQPYDIVSPIFMLLFGEESKRPFDPFVMTVNSDSVSKKLQEKKSTILSMLNEYLLADIVPQDPENPPPTPEEISKYSQMSVKDMREKVSQDLLNYYMKHCNLPDMFATGWKDALIAAEEIYSIDEIAGSPKPRRVNPLEIQYILGANKFHLDDAEKIYEKNRMSISEIIDEFYEELTSDQISILEEARDNGLSAHSFSAGGPTVQDYFGNIPVINSIYDLDDSQGVGWDVHRVRWKSKRKMGTLHYIDPTTQMEVEELVDEFYKPTKGDPNVWIEWFWINEYWEGIRIGQDMYLKIRPRKQQFRSMDNLSECKSGYVGTVYNALNAQAVSLMDRLFPWVALYLIVFYRTELLIAKNHGKLGQFDTSLIPDGWEIEKWMYYAQSMGFAFVNSYNEGAKGERTGRFNQSQQNKALDLETGNSIQFHIELLSYLESKMKDTAGVTDQRLGAISPSELVGNTERAVVQSSHVTEEWFRIHNDVKLRVCTAIIEVAKDCMENDYRAYQYITDDLATVLFEVDGNDFMNADYGAFIVNGGKEKEALETLKGLMQSALQADKLNFSDAAVLLNSNSSATIKAKIKESELRKEQMEAQMQQEQLAMQQAQLEQELQMELQRMDLEYQKLELERYKIDTEAQTRIQTAEIQVFSRQQNLDLDQDGIADPVELGKLALQDRELKSKEMIEKLKIEQTKIQNESQERIAKQQAALKEKEMLVKERIEKLKIKAKPKPSKSSPKK